MISFVVPTYNRIDNLRSMLSSLICQSNPNWEAIVIVDGLDWSDRIRNMIYDLKDKRIRMYVLGSRYNDWGHTPRELGKAKATGDYVIMTGDDNYYVPTFVEEVIKAAHDKPGMIYWDMVHNHYDYQLFITTPAFNQIDIGAFATRKDLCDKLKLNTTFAADGEFVEDFKREFPNEKIVKIKKVLYVHN